MSLIRLMRHGERNKKVIFLLSGWRINLWMLWPVAKILERNRYYCITYAYDNSVLSPNTAQTIENLTLVANDILSVIKDLKKDGCEDFFIFGTSLGTLIALMVANKSSDISKIILNTTGADIAESIWGWNSIHRYFKESLLKQNYTLEKLQSTWMLIHPQNNIDNLQDKKILIFLSKNDDVIPYYLGEKLIQGLKHRKYHHRVIVNSHLKHLHTAIFNLLNAKEYLNFLKE